LLKPSRNLAESEDCRVLLDFTTCGGEAVFSAFGFGLSAFGFEKTLAGWFR
jgi:hypothetical protein